MSYRHSLEAQHLSLGYGPVAVVSDLSLTVPSGRVTTIVGANACGKSTLLRGLARLLRPTTGQVLLDGRSIHDVPTREVATRMGLLPQSPVAPEGLTVVDLVGRGRYPHQGWFRQWSQDDEAAVARALEATETLALARRTVDELSGGQRQRVWIAMALAQETDVLLLDEPTTFLDVAHQVDVLDLLVELNRRRGTTVVAVLHDLNLAARYSDHMVAMKAGEVVAGGAPAEVVTEPTIGHVFDMRCAVVEDPVSGTPMVIPISRRHPTADAQATESTPEGSVPATSNRRRSVAPALSLSGGERS
jgi:iron complex transport system ATP-binding protein